MFCTECGKENPDGAKFCFNCGIAVGQTEDAVPEPASAGEGTADQSEPPAEVGRFCALAIAANLLSGDQCEAVLQAFRDEGISPDIDSFISTAVDNGLCADGDGLEQLRQRVLSESRKGAGREREPSPVNHTHTDELSKTGRKSVFFGLNWVGLVTFLALLVIWPLCWIPWLIPPLRGTKPQAQEKGRTRLVAVLGCTVIVIVVAVSMRSAFQQAQEKSRRINCAGNLKQIGLALRMYSGDHGDHFPPDFAVLIQQDYLTTKKVYTCPSTSTLPATDLNQFLTEDHCDYLYFGAGLIEDCEGHPPGQTIIACDDFANHVGAIKDKAVIVLFADGRVRIVGGINAIEDLAGRQGLFLPTGERREDGALIPQPSEASSNVTVDQRTDTASSAGEDLTTPETPSAETNTPTAPETAAISFSDLCSFPTQLPESFDRSRLDRKIVSTNEEVKPSAISLVIQAQSGGIPLKLRTDGSFDLPLDVALQRENPWVVSNQPKGTLRVQCTAFGQEIEKKKAEERRRRKRAVIESAQRTVNSRWRYNPESGHYRRRDGGGAISKGAYQRKVRALAESWYNGAVDWIWYQDF